MLLAGSVQTTLILTNRSIFAKIFRLRSPETHRVLRAIKIVRSFGLGKNRAKAIESGFAGLTLCVAGLNLDLGLLVGSTNSSAAKTLIDHISGAYSMNVA